MSLSFDLDEIAAHQPERGEDKAGNREQNKSLDKQEASRPLLIWFLFFLFVLSLVAGSFYYRSEIIMRWPAAAQIYSTLGIPVMPPEGVDMIAPEIGPGHRR